MAVEIYLGNPPDNIKQWIIDHVQPAGHADTRFTLQGGTVESYNITGTLDQQWMIDNGFFDVGEWEWTKNITEVDIGSTVTNIGSGAFAGCESLTSVTISGGVTSIGNSAFAGCESLTSVTIPDSVTSIGSNAFASCSRLVSVTIPNSVTSIGEYAFTGSNLTSVTIPDSVTSIGSNAFMYCSGLTNVTFQGKTLAQVQEMDDYSWGIDPSIINVA